MEFTKVSNQKNVNLNDPRYQLADKLKPATVTNQTSFSIYNSHLLSKMSVSNIIRNYSISDKDIPIGEILNKMLDLITDLQDGVLDTEKDAVTAWKYSNALLTIFEDRIKRNKIVNCFDNSLKAGLINCSLFIERFPNKYTLRTDFYDKKVLLSIVKDVTKIFKEETLPVIFKLAIEQSKQLAERHENEVLDKIAGWAVDKYNCKADSYFEIREDDRTKLFYAIDTIILHLPNGYDLSIVGFVGTDEDDKFSVSSFNTQTVEMGDSEQGVESSKVREMLAETSEKEYIDPILSLIAVSQAKASYYLKQYEELKEIKPMVSYATLKLPVAEKIVGKDYIWKSNEFRLTHKELPEDFNPDELFYPTYEESEQAVNNVPEDSKEQVEAFDAVADSFTEIINNVEPEQEVVPLFDMNDDTESRHDRHFDLSKEKDDDGDDLSTILPGIADLKAKIEAEQPVIPEQPKLKHEAEEEYDMSTLLPGNVEITERVEAPVSDTLTSTAQTSDYEEEQSLWRSEEQPVPSVQDNASEDNNAFNGEFDDSMFDDLFK